MVYHTLLRQNLTKIGEIGKMPGIFQVYPGFPRYTRKIPGIIANLAEFGRKPASRLGSDPEKLMIPLSFVIYHTTLCSYHTTP